MKVDELKPGMFFYGCERIPTLHKLLEFHYTYLILGVVTLGPVNYWDISHVVVYVYTNYCRDGMWGIDIRNAKSGEDFKFIVGRVDETSITSDIEIIE